MGVGEDDPPEEDSDFDAIISKCKCVVQIIQNKKKVCKT